MGRYKWGNQWGLGFRVVVSGVISRVTILMAHVRGLITPLITSLEPPSRVAAIQESTARLQPNVVSLRGL